jgi:hypothetical protein
MRARVAIAGALLAGVAAVPALAADPGSGTVSMSTPKVTWTGQSVNGGATTIPAVANGGAEACVAPSCDTFALTVADSADLTVIADAPETGGFTMVQVVLPDGTKVYNSGAEDETTTKVKVKKAPKGDYEVQIAANALPPTDYSASAELTVPPPPAAPAPTAPAPTPTTAPPPAAAPEPGARLTLKTRTVSAKRSRTAPKLVLTTDREVTNVRAQLKKGSKTLGKASLAKLTSKGTLKFKLRRKLKPGKYVVAVAATDGGRTVGLRAPLKVKR